MPKGLKHTQEVKDKISAAAKITMSQPNAGFRQRVSCGLCGQVMSPANLGKHLTRCEQTRGMTLNGHQLSVKELKILKTRLKKSQWTLQEYLVAHEEQKGLCMICSAPPTKSRLAADHCHQTMQPRALLCENCNLGLGAFKDNVSILQKAIEYLGEYSK
jgi:hypothetical protein